jgi:hypothetical protein
MQLRSTLTLVEFVPVVLVGDMKKMFAYKNIARKDYDRLCGLAVRVSGYRSRGPGFNYRPYQIF